MADEFMAKPCAQCPYRNDVKPFLTPERGDELANIVHNPYNYFPCHKTTENGDDGETVNCHKEKMCAGFLTLQAAETGENQYEEEGFKPSYELCYADSWEMTEAYEQ